MPTAKQFQASKNPYHLELEEQQTGIWSEPWPQAISGATARRQAAYERLKEEVYGKDKEAADPYAINIGSKAGDWIFGALGIEGQYMLDSLLHGTWAGDNTLWELGTAALNTYGNAAAVQYGVSKPGSATWQALQADPNRFDNYLQSYRNARDPAYYGITSPEMIEAASMAPIAAYGMHGNIFENANSLNIQQNYGTYMQFLAQKDKGIYEGEQLVAGLYALAEMTNPRTNPLPEWQMEALGQIGWTPGMAMPGGGGFLTGQGPYTSEQFTAQAVMLESEIFKLRNSSPADYLENNLSIVNQMIAGFAFDPMYGVDIGIGLMGLTKGQQIARNANRLYSGVNDMEAARRIATAAAGGGAATLYGARAPGFWGQVLPLADPATTRAAKNLDPWDVLGAGLARTTNDRSNLSYLLGQVANGLPGEAFAGGIDVSGIPGLANQADSSGRFHFSPDVWANASAIKNWDVFEAVKDKIATLPSLQGADPLNPDAFQQEWTGLFRAATEQYYGVGQPGILSSAWNAASAWFGARFSGPVPASNYALPPGSGVGYNPLIGPQVSPAEAPIGLGPGWTQQVDPETGEILGSRWHTSPEFQYNAAIGPAQASTIPIHDWTNGVSGINRGTAAEAPAWLDEWDDEPYVPIDRTPANFINGGTPDYPSWLDEVNASHVPFGGQVKPWFEGDMWRRGPADEQMVYADDPFGSAAIGEPPQITPSLYQGEISDIPYGPQWPDPRPQRPTVWGDVGPVFGPQAARASVAPNESRIAASKIAALNAAHTLDNASSVSAGGPIGGGILGAIAGAARREFDFWWTDGIAVNLPIMAQDLLHFNEHQRSAAVELFINPSTGAWIGNAVTANIGAAVDVGANFRHIDDLENNLRYRSGLTSRIRESVPPEASMPRHQSFLSIALDYDASGPSVFDGAGYLANPGGSARNPLAQASVYASTLWTGNRNILGGHLGFGEAANAERVADTTQVGVLQRYGQQRILDQEASYTFAGMSDAGGFVRYMADAMVEDPNNRGAVLRQFQREQQGIETAIATKTNEMASMAPGTPEYSRVSTEIAVLHGDLNNLNANFQTRARDINRNGGRGYFAQLADEYINPAGGMAPWMVTDQRPVTLQQHTLEQANRTRIQDVFAQETLPAYDSAMAASAQAATDQVRFTMYDSSMKNNMTSWLSAWTAFANFAVSSVTHTVQRLAGHPSLFSGYLNVERSIDRENDRNQVTKGDIGTFPLTIGGQEFRVRNFYDRLLMPIGNITGNSFYDEMIAEATEEGDWVKRIGATLGRFGFQPMWLQSFVTGMEDELPIERISPTLGSLAWLGTAGTAYVNSLLNPSNVGQTGPGSVFGWVGSDTAEGNMGQYVLAQVNAGTYTAEEGRMIIDYINRRQEGLPPAPGEPANLEQMYQEVLAGFSFQMGISQASSTSLGLRAKPVTEAQQGLHQARIYRGQILDMKDAAERGELIGSVNDVWDAYGQLVGMNPGLLPGLADGVNMLYPDAEIPNEDGYTRPAQIPLTIGKDTVVAPGVTFPGDEYTYPTTTHRPPVPDLPVEDAARINPNSIVSLGGPYSTLGDRSPFAGVHKPTMNYPSAPYSLEPQVGTPAGIQGDDFTTMPEVGDATQQKLYEAGYTTWSQLGRATYNEIASIPEIDAKLAQTIYDSSRSVGQDQYIGDVLARQAQILGDFRDSGSDYSGVAPTSLAPVQEAPLTFQEELELLPDIGPSTASSLVAHYDSWGELADASPKWIDDNIKGYGPALSQFVVDQARLKLAGGGSSIDPAVRDYSGNTDTPDDYWLYVLSDPRDDQIHYVGKTVRAPLERFSEHLNEDVPEEGINHPKTRWIRGLLQEGMEPEQHVLGHFGSEQAMSDWELIWIGYFVYSTGAQQRGVLGNVELPKYAEYQALMQQYGVIPSDLDAIWRDIPTMGSQTGEVTAPNAGSYGDVLRQNIIRAPIKDYMTAGQAVSGAPVFSGIEGLTTAQRSVLGGAGFDSWEAILAGGESAALKRLDALPGFGEVNAQKVYDYALAQIEAANQPGWSPFIKEMPIFVTPEPTAGIVPMLPNVADPYRYDPLSSANAGSLGYRTYIPTYGVLGGSAVPGGGRDYTTYVPTHGSLPGAMPQRQTIASSDGWLAQHGRRVPGEGLWEQRPTGDSWLREQSMIQANGLPSFPYPLVGSGANRQYVNTVLKPGVLPGQAFYIESMETPDGSLTVGWDPEIEAYRYNGLAYDPTKYRPYEATDGSARGADGTVVYDGVEYGGKPYSAHSTAIASVMAGGATTATGSSARPFVGEHNLSQGYGVNPERYTSWGGHMGLDYAMPIGTQLTAMMGGTVVDTGFSPKGGKASRPGTGGFGNWIILEHPGGYTTEYAHLSEILVKAGQEIEPGQVIGLSGHTGVSDMPHLHFGVRQDGKYIDPNAFYGAAGASVSAGSDPNNPYAADFARVGAQFGLPPAMLQTLAKRESNFTPAPGNGYGMMQIENATWAQIQAANPHLTDRENPAQAIEAAGWYLDWVNDNLEKGKKGDPFWIAAGYNMGVGAVNEMDGPEDILAYDEHGKARLSYANEIAGAAGTAAVTEVTPSGTKWKTSDENPSPQGYFNFEMFPDIGHAKERALYAAGITSIETLLGTTPEALDELKDFGPTLAANVLRYAAEVAAGGGIVPTAQEQGAKAADNASVLKVKDEHQGKPGWFNWEQFPDVGEAKEKILYGAGITSPQQLIDLGIQGLIDLDEFGRTGAEKLYGQVQSYMGIEPAAGLSTTRAARGGMRDIVADAEAEKNKTTDDANVSSMGWYNFEVYKGIGPTKEQALYAAGITSVEKLLGADVGFLEDIPGFGPKLVEQLLAEAGSAPLPLPADGSGGKKGKPSYRPQSFGQDFYRSDNAFWVTEEQYQDKSNRDKYGNYYIYEDLSVVGPSFRRWAMGDAGLPSRPGTLGPLDEYGDGYLADWSHLTGDMSMGGIAQRFRRSNSGSYPGGIPPLPPTIPPGTPVGQLKAQAATEHGFSVAGRQELYDLRTRAYYIRQELADTLPGGGGAQGRYWAEGAEKFKTFVLAPEGNNPQAASTMAHEFGHHWYFNHMSGGTREKWHRGDWLRSFRDAKAAEEAAQAYWMGLPDNRGHESHRQNPVEAYAYAVQLEHDVMSQGLKEEHFGGLFKDAGSVWEPDPVTRLPDVKMFTPGATPPLSDHLRDLPPWAPDKSGNFGQVDSRDFRIQGESDAPRGAKALSERQVKRIVRESEDSLLEELAKLFGNGAR